MILSLLIKVIFLDCIVKGSFMTSECSQTFVFFRRQLCPFRNREQNFKSESSYFATWVKGLYRKDSVVSSRHSSRQPFRGPSATPRNLRMCVRLVTLPLQASTCTKQAWGWTVWRTFIQIRENRYLFFVVVMSYECILNCVPFFIIYALTIPIPPSPSVGNLVLRSFQSSESSGIIPCFREPQWPEELLLQGSSLLAHTAWEVTDLAVRSFQMESWLLILCLLLLRTFEITLSCHLVFIIAGLFWILGVPSTEVIGDLLTVCTWAQIMFRFLDTSHKVSWTWFEVKVCGVIAFCREGTRAREKNECPQVPLP